LDAAHFQPQIYQLGNRRIEEEMWLVLVLDFPAYPKVLVNPYRGNNSLSAGSSPLIVVDGDDNF